MKSIASGIASRIYAFSALFVPSLIVGCYFPWVLLLCAYRFPILVSTTGSLRAVNDAAAASSSPTAPVRSVQFRPNVIIATENAWEEDDWHTLRISAPPTSSEGTMDSVMELRLVKPCTRCEVCFADVHIRVSYDVIDPSSYGLCMVACARSWQRIAVFSTVSSAFSNFGSCIDKPCVQKPHIFLRLRFRPSTRSAARLASAANRPPR
jgi:hypothetical protein